MSADSTVHKTDSSVENHTGIRIRPYYEHAGITIYHGDCRDVLPSLAPGSVDLVLTDPPYGIGFSYGTETYTDRSAGYEDWMWPTLEVAERAIKPTGCFGVFQSAKNARMWARWFPREWRLIAIPKLFVQMNTALLTWATDYCLLWTMPEAPRGRQKWQPSPARDWFVSKDSCIPRTGPEKDHPCPRAPDMMRHLLHCLCPPGGIALDPFSGAGTTLLEARKMHLAAIGIEIEERYCEIAAKRLSQDVFDWEIPQTTEGEPDEGDNLFSTLESA